MQETMEILVSKARTGDSKAIQSLYEESYKSVYYTIRAMVSDEDTVLDLTQDTFMKAFSSLDCLEIRINLQHGPKRSGAISHSII